MSIHLNTPGDVFRTKDGHMAIAAAGDEHFRFLAQIMGRGELTQDGVVAATSPG